MARIYIETFGCQMNEADSRDIVDRASAAGYEVTSDPSSASVVVLNTCTVRDNAERRAYGRMAHLRALKAGDPGMKLVVCGCLAEQDRDRMHVRAPYLDGVFGTSELARLGDRLAEWRAEFEEPTEAAEQRSLLRLGGEPDCIAGPFSHVRAFVTVQRGCSYYCTFCIVPHVRGRFDHRPLRDVTNDVRTAVARGAREILLVGQTVNAYRDPGSGADFSDLLETVAGVEGLDRLGFLTSHPKDCTEKLVRTLGAVPHLNPRFHLPLQSGSNPVLRRMNRKYTVEAYVEKIAAFRRYCPDWALSTDLIVGFPGESEEDFEATLEICRGIGFSQAFMFVYSPRRGTPAALWDQVAGEVASDRLRRLAAVVDVGVRAWHERKVGRTVRALVQGASRKDPSKLAMKTTDNVTVVAPAPACSYDTVATRPWLDVAIERAHVWGCTGEITGGAERYDGPAVPFATAAIDLVGLVRT